MSMIEFASDIMLWPGGSLVSGDIEHGGGEAEGTLEDYNPAFPMTPSVAAQQPTLIDLSFGGNGMSAIAIEAFRSGTESGSFTFNLNLWLVLLYPIICGTAAAPTPGFIPKIVQLTWASDSSAVFTTAAGDIGPLPNSCKAINGTVSDLSTYWAPLAYPFDNIPRDGANTAAPGWGRDYVKGAGSANTIGGAYVIPTTGARKAFYKINRCNVDGVDSSIEDIDVRLLYQLLRK